MATEDGIARSKAWHEDVTRALYHARACIGLVTGGQEDIDGQCPEDFVREAYLHVGIRADLTEVFDAILLAVELAAKQAKVS